MYIKKTYHPVILFKLMMISFLEKLKKNVFFTLFWKNNPKTLFIIFKIYKCFIFAKWNKNSRKKRYILINFVPILSFLKREINKKNYSIKYVCSVQIEKKKKKIFWIEILKRFNFLKKVNEKVIYSIQIS